MALDDLARGIRKTLGAVGIVGGVLSGSVNAQEQKEPPVVEQGIPFPKKYFKIDDFVASSEGTPEERKKLAEELFAYVLQHSVSHPDGSKEKVFPLELSNEPVGVRVIIFPGNHKQMRVLIFRGDNTPVALIDDEITGTPSEHQLPVEEKGITRPQGFIVTGEHPLANRMYLGILRQLMSKF